MPEFSEECFERLVMAHERLALAIESFVDEVRRAGMRYWPLPSQQREAVVSRVESEEERELRMQGARRRTVNEVVDPTVEEVPDEFIGERTRQWLRDHPKEVKKSIPSGEDL